MATDDCGSYRTVDVVARFLHARSARCPGKTKVGGSVMNDITTQLLLLVAGAIAGIVSGAVGAGFKMYLDWRSESRKSEVAVRLQYLYPLLTIATELKRKLTHIYNALETERDITTPEPKMTDRYYLRHWFWRCKDYVVNPDKGWTEEQRRRDLAMHSGGVGYDAVSTLYITASYLWHATRIRLRIPSELKGKGIQLLRCLDRVRTSLADLDFYDVAQDSTGASTTGKDGDVMNYRDFCEAMTSDAQRAWFLTLTDVYFKLHRKGREYVDMVIQSLEALVDLLTEMLELDAEAISR